MRVVGIGFSVLTPPTLTLSSGEAAYRRGGGATAPLLSNRRGAKPGRSRSPLIFVSHKNYFGSSPPAINRTICQSFANRFADYRVNQLKSAAPLRSSACRSFANRLPTEKGGGLFNWPNRKFNRPVKQSGPMQRRNSDANFCGHAPQEPDEIGHDGQTGGQEHPVGQQPREGDPLRPGQPGDPLRQYRRQYRDHRASTTTVRPRASASGRSARPTRT